MDLRLEFEAVVFEPQQRVLTPRLAEAKVPHQRDCGEH